MSVRHFMLPSLLLAGLLAGCADSSDGGGEAAQVGDPGPKWDYDGAEGPPEWAKLSPSFATCASGQQQSPIDLVGGAARDLPDIKFNYAPGPIIALNNGHTIELRPSQPHSIEIDGKTYQMAQSHFHHPSEHTIAGKSYPLELHMVHLDSAGAPAVVGILFEAGASPNAELSGPWSALPAATDETKPGALDFTNLLPADRSMFAYEGSLTTPPCSEGVRWHVLSTPLPISNEQVEAFKTLFENNARPVQPLQGRSLEFEAASAAR